MRQLNSMAVSSLPQRHLVTLAFAIVFLLFSQSNGITQVPSAPVDDPLPDFPKLIADLGSSKFTVREKAAKRLKENDEAIPFLQKAMKSSDAEIAARAGKILEELTYEIDHRPLLIASNLAKLGKIDWAVEMLAGWGGAHDDPALWQAALNVGWTLKDRYDKSVKKVVTFKEADLPPREFGNYRQALRGREPIVLDLDNLKDPRDANGALYRGGKSFRLENLTRNVLILTDSVDIGLTISDGFIFANQAVTIHGLSNAIVFAAEDVKLTSQVANSLVIGHRITCPTDLSNSTLFAASISSNSKRGTSFNGDNLLVTTAGKPLDFVTRFEPVDIGVHPMDKSTKDAYGIYGLIVEALDPGTALERAGVTPMDLITAVDGLQTKNSDPLRKCLLKASVKDSCNITVYRGNKFIDLKVDFKSDRKRLLKETTRKVEEMERSKR